MLTEMLQFSAIATKKITNTGKYNSQYYTMNKVLRFTQASE